MNQDRFKFRVWCVTNNEWEKDACTLCRNGELYAPLHGRTYRQDTHIIEQCTGLKDFNGKLIYEGDVVFNEHRSHEFLVVTWRRGSFYAGKGKFMLLPDWDAFTVLGNIHENPDLLK